MGKRLLLKMSTTFRYLDIKQNSGYEQKFLRQEVNSSTTPA